MFRPAAEPSNPEHYKRSMQLPRANLGPIARFIHENGCKRFQPDLLAPRRGPLGLFGRQKFNPTPEEAVQIYHKGKKERYGLTAVMVDEVIDRALFERDDRGPYGLVGYKVDPQTWEAPEDAEPEVIKWLGPNDPFRYLDAYLGDTLAIAWEDEMDFYSDFSKLYPEDPHSKTFTRLKQWERFYNTHLPLGTDGAVQLPEVGLGYSFSSVFTEDGTGIGTARRFKPSLLRVIPQVCDKQFADVGLDINQVNPEFLTGVARNSFSLISKTAMLPFDVQPVLHDIISSEAFHPDYRTRGVDESKPYDRGVFDPIHFNLKSTRDGYRLDYADHVWDQLDHFMGYTLDSGQHFTTGCPAMARLGEDESAMKRLWDWMVDVGGQVYKDYWPLFEPRAAKEQRYNFIKQNAEARGMRVAGIHF